MAIPLTPLDIRLESERFLFRTLNAGDASQRWCGWLEDPHAVRMLNAKPQRLTLERLGAYIASFDQKKKLLCGIFDKASGLHVGILTAEFSDDGTRLLPAILIGEAEYRDIGVLSEIRDLMYDYAFENLSIEAATGTVLEHNAPMRHFIEANGWVFVRRLPSEKKRADGQGYLDLLIYEYTRQTWEKQRAERPPPARDKAP